jgi:2-oxoglutarate dehydrogenase E1 component
VAYDAMARRDELGDAGQGVVVVRVEQLYPWPKANITAVLDRYPNAHEVVWLQEEPENMGAWTFVHGRLHRILRDSHTLRHVSRAESASPATGSAALHRLEQDDLLGRAVG